MIRTLWGFLVLIPGFLGQPDPTIVQLEPPEQGPKEPDSGKVKLMADGSVLIYSNTRIWRWSRTGALLGEFAGTSSTGFKSVIDCHFDPANALYWVIEYGEGNPVVFDESGSQAGVLKYMGFQGLDLPVFRKILPVGRRLFALDLGGFDPWYNPGAPVLVEIGLQRDGDRWAVVQRGDHFQRFSSQQIRFDANFKLFWIVEDPYHENLYVMDQLTPVVFHYVPSQRNGWYSYELRPERIFPALPHYRPPPNALNYLALSKPEYLRWWFSWSRINGFYGLGDDFLIGYEVPDPKHPKRNLQALQRTTRSGRSIGPVHLETGLLVGVYDEQAILLFHTNGQAPFAYGLKRMSM